MKNFAVNNIFIIIIESNAISDKSFPEFSSYYIFNILLSQHGFITSKLFAYTQLLHWVDNKIIAKFNEDENLY